jgi:HlyD family secretion protein
MSQRLRLTLLSLGIFLGCLALALVIQILGATEEKVPQEVRVDHVKQLEDGRFLVHVLPDAPAGKELTVNSITRYPGGWAVVTATGEGGLLKPPALPTLVRSSVLEPGPVERQVLAFGSVEATRDAQVSCEVGGKVLQVLVQLGSAVTKGAPLVELDPRDADLALRRSSADLAGARASLARLEVELEVTHDQLIHVKETLETRARERERIKELEAKGIASTTQVDQADVAWRAASGEHTRLSGALRTARAGLAEARALVVRREADQATATLARERCTVRAPFAGNVADRLIEVGDLLGAGAPVIRVVAQEQVRVRVHVREEQALALGAGNAAWLTVPGLPALDGAELEDGTERGLSGKVVGISAAADPKTRKVAVDVSFENTGGLLRDGMFARVRLEAGQVPGTYLIPDTAVVATRAGTFVYLLTGDSVTKRRIRLGARQGEGRIHRGGLEGKVELATSGLGLLFEGAPIRRLSGEGPAPLSPGDR